MVEEVATALLDATRRMSLGRRPATTITPSSPINTAPSSTSLSSSMSSHGSGWFSNGSGSSTELDDKTSSLPKTIDGGGWFGAGFSKRNRTVSESDGGRVKIDVVSWLAGPVGLPPMRKISEPIGGGVKNRIRRSSSKDVEEAMAGGLNKADIYMPPF